MAKETQYVFDKIAAGEQQVVPPRDENFLDKAAETTGKVTNFIQAIDRALNPQNYPQQTYQPTQQPQQQAGFGWGKVLLIAAVGGGLVYGGKQILDNQKKKSK